MAGVAVAASAVTAIAGTGPAQARERPRPMGPAIVGRTLDGGLPLARTGTPHHGTPTTRGLGPQATLYTATMGYRANLRSAPTLRTPGTIVGKLPNGTRLEGRFNSTGYWFKVTRGRHAGRWVAGSSVQKSVRSNTINGLMARSALAPVPMGSARRGGAAGVPLLSRPAADAFANMNRAFRARFGYDLGVLEGYRSLSTQRLYAKKFGYPRAAVPGTSNHGFGNAIDVAQVGCPGTSSPFFFGHVHDRWLTQNAWKWGFDRPPELDAGGSNPEFWHYNFVG